MLKASDHIYFKGLNGLRFFAALAVIITHIELIKEQMGCPDLWETGPMIKELGSLGVIFFFVLSGFLITYLLLQEKSVTGTIVVKKFYIRRLLRIWPLYFLIVFLGFLVLTHFEFMDIPYLKNKLSHNFGTNFLLYVVMLPNLAFAMFAAVPHIGQTWSIGVEEQFYIIWPLIVKHSKNILKALIFIIIFLVGLKVLVLFSYKADPTNSFLNVLKPFLVMTKMECMAIGGLGAYFLFSGEKIKVLFNNGLLVLSFALIVISVYFTPDVIQDGIYLMNSVLFLIIILNVSSNPNCFLKLENNAFKMLGNISYGIYMYHMIVIAMVVGFLKKMDFTVDNGVLSQSIVYSLTILISIFVSWLSYTYFEKWFLKLKSKFTIIKSGIS